jgi:hypothetical protein
VDLFLIRWKNGISLRHVSPLSWEGAVAGVAVESPEACSAEDFRRQIQPYEPFVLYIGRIDHLRM